MAPAPPPLPTARHELLTANLRTQNMVPLLGFRSKELVGFLFGGILSIIQGPPICLPIDQSQPVCYGRADRCLFDRRR